MTPKGVVRDAAVVVDDRHIVGLYDAGRYPVDDQATVVRLPRTLLLPGLVNAHSHAFQRAFRGHVQWKAEGRDDFWSWRRAMYAVANRLTPEALEAVSALAFLEMVESGITTVGEFHYVHHQPDGTPYADPDELAKRVISAAQSVGLKICLLRTAYARAGHNAALRIDQRRFGDASPHHVLEALDRLSTMAPVGLAPHSVRAVPADWLDTLSQFDGPIHAHISEQPAENESCMSENGCSPTALFGRHGLLSSRFTAVHMTFPMAGDLALLREAGSTICACPTTEMDLGDGFLPLEARTLPLCLGTDSQAAIDLFWEARTLELHARALAGQRNVLSDPGDRDALAMTLCRAATIQGDVALGGAGAGLSAGAPADMIGVDLNRPAAAGVPPLEAAMFNGNPAWVSDVWIAGRRVVSGGVHPLRESVCARAAPFLTAP